MMKVKPTKATKRYLMQAPLLAAASLTALGTMVPVALAQEKAALTTLEEIVVVARRTEENLQTVPLSVTAITTEVLKANTIQSGLDLQKMVPTLSVAQGTQASAATYSLRGIRSGVLTYFDETPSLQSQAGAAAVNFQLFDLASVQAVSGPQGTLFGRNSTGGAILFVPQKPTEEFGGSVDAGIGNYGRHEITATLNLPVSDALQLRLGGQTIRREGLVDNLSGRDLQSQHRDSFRVSALFKPTDWLTNYTLLDGGNTDETQFANITAGYPGGNCPSALFACFYGSALPEQLQAQQDQLGIRKVATPYPEELKGQERGAQNTLTVDFGETTLKYIAAYRTSKLYQLSNQLSLAIPAVVGQAFNESEQLTQELQLSGTAFDDRLNWVTGLFYRDHHSDNFNALMILAPLNAPVFSLDAAQGSPVESDNKSKAIYAQGTLAVTDRLDVTVGLRYTEDDQSTVFSAFAPGFTCILNPTVTGVDFANCKQAQSEVFEATTYNLSVGYQLTAGTYLYAATRSGYNAGGFNQGLEPDSSAYDPEELTDYELGVKSDWRIGVVPVRTNFSTFYGSYEDIQRGVVRTVATPTGARAFSGTFNAAEATIYGAQLEFQVRPLESLIVSGSYGYLHSEYDEFIVDAFQTTGTGNSFAQAPEHTANVSATFNHQLDLGELVANASYSYLSKVTFSDTNLGRDIAFEDGYGLVDARLELKNIGGLPLDVGIWGKNLTDKEYAVFISDVPSLGFTSIIYSDPRTYGMNVKYRFGG